MHRWLAIIPALLAALTSFAAADTKPAAPSAAERMQQSGAEEQQLKRRIGKWTVKSTFVRRRMRSPWSPSNSWPTAGWWACTWKR